MEPSGDRQSAEAPVGVWKSKLRYPLRSVGKPREAAAAAGAGSAKRGGLKNSVSSVELSAIDKACKPSRRLSIPSKSSMTSRPETDGIATHAVEKKKTEGKSVSPASTVIPKTTGKKKFSALSSVSYWLSQIKLSESASKHSISLGFFKLAMESECEPMKRMEDELKFYALRHDIINELGDPAKELLRSYNILEDVEGLNVSHSCSKVASDGTNPPKEDESRNPAKRSGNLRRRSLSSNLISQEPKRERVGKISPAAKVRASCSSISVNVPNLDDTGRNGEKNLRNSGKATAKAPRKRATVDASIAGAEALKKEGKENENNAAEVAQEQQTKDVQSTEALEVHSS